MADIDFPGATGLIKVIKEYKDANIDVMLAGCKSGVREMLEAAGFNDKLCCRNCMYLSIHDAVVAAINKYPSIRHQLESDKDSILGMHNGHMISHHDNQDDDLGNYSNPENPLLDGAKNNN
ncbi:hypothetical protein CAPTEDRAFT_213174 [Capitella teleta]|uniref:STAS domain-containing protein n=1 Tax=Capitella teleta TaxID=283909 RepID=R7V9V1_CAPTE|nr:hypothetical protein CAPTEDRAFT_213174 [Capitella teleta]|eukprot:ELU12520.1 hypothetical protein CAPTEDRAFT_213174 [Capitella teleta]